MKNRSRVSSLFVLAGGLILLAIWFGKKRSVAPASAPAGNTPVASETAQPTNSDSTPENVASPSEVAEKASTSAPPVPPKVEERRQILANLNSDEIVFYGKVLDQFGTPVADAVVSANIGVNNGTRIGTDRPSTKTGAEGLFTISGYRGKDLGINVSKKGYVMAATNTAFVYSLLWPENERHKPDPRNPTILRMWKLQGAEPLIDISKEFRFPVTGASVSIDLLKGELSRADGDLQLTIARVPGSVSKRYPGDWSVQIAAVNGGVIESDYRASSVTFEAPADGYQPTYRIEMKHDDPAWFDGFAKTFFLKSRGGQIYSKFTLDFGINREPNDDVYVNIRGVANTNSSRNWEATVPQTQRSGSGESL